MPTRRSKLSWLLPVPPMTVAALLQAQAVAQIVGTGLALDASELARPPAEGPNRPPPSAARVVSARPILERNPFDHVTGSLLPAVDAGGPAPVDSADPLSAPTCEDVDVRAIVYGDDAEWSFASFASKDGKAHLLRRGGEVGGRSVHFVGRDRAWLAADGKLCQARLFDQKKLAPGPAPAAPAKKPFVPPARVAAANVAAALPPDLRQGIRAVSPTEFEIDRGVLDRILENQAQLMRQARIVPVQENGRVAGVRLVGLRRDTLFPALGMQNGDVLRTINGFDLGSPEKALEAYARLRTAERLQIQISREGRPISLDYRIK